MGISVVVLYPFAPYLNAALDWFRSRTDWWAGDYESMKEPILSQLEYLTS